MWQVGASHHSHLHLSVDHEAKADSVLTTAEKALGAVDGVERPASTLCTAFSVSSVNGGEELLLAQVAVTPSLGVGFGLGFSHSGAFLRGVLEGLVGKGKDLDAQRLGLGLLQVF